MLIFFRQLRWLALLPLGWVACHAQAASLSINPVMISLDGSNAISAMTVTNQGDESVVMQATLNAWSIQDNHEAYQPTDALIVNPPIFELAAGASQIVRVGLSDTTPKTREQSFRVFLEQAPAIPEERQAIGKDFMAALSSTPVSVPAPAKAQTPRAVQLMLRIGIPVFVRPSVAQTRPLEWSASRLPGGRVKVEASNTGNLHVRISELSLMKVPSDSAEPTVIQSRESLRYILPGSRRHWVFDASPRQTAPYYLKAETSTGVVEHTIPFLAP